MNRKAVCKKPRKRDSVCQTTHPEMPASTPFGGSSLPWRWKRLMLKKPSHWDQPISLCFCFFNEMILTIVIINIITLSLPPHHHSYPFIFTITITITVNDIVTNTGHGLTQLMDVKWELANFFCQKKFAGNKCSQLCEP